jgi:hypothetical protein
MRVEGWRTAREVIKPGEGEWKPVTTVAVDARTTTIKREYIIIISVGWVLLAMALIYE